MMRPFRFLMTLALLLGVVWLALGTSIFTAQQAFAAPITASVSPVLSPEGNDFATQILKDAWDMNQYKDISKYLNESGVNINLTNIMVENGVFSATSTNQDAQFYTLFPGYRLGFNSGKYGVNYPISSAKYHCFSMRAKIDTPVAEGIRIFWFEDENLAAAPFGVSKIIDITPGKWTIYNVDLNTNYDNLNSELRWTDRSYWQGLRIDPTSKQNVNFSVDWVRLTDCTERNVTFSWTPFNATGELWMGRAPNSPETLLAGNVDANTSSAQINVSGWEAGDYYLGIKNKTTNNFQWNSLKIVAAPHVEIQKPSFTSGEGMLWPMDSIHELDLGTNKTRCVDYQINNSILSLSTAPPASIGSSCRAGGYSDPQLYLQMPISPFSTGQYRYLTYKLNTEGAWQDINKGWVFRWLWFYHKSGQLCIGVTYGISIDVGWERYALDMYDPAIGTPNYTEYCSIQPWSANPIDYLRFDPNENDTTTPIVQQIDWISINKMDQVQKGQLFPVEISTSVPVDGLNLSFFYTTSPSLPTANAMVIVDLPQSSPPGNHHLYLPTIANGSSSLTGNGIRYYWDTGLVPKGTYYVCIRSQDQAGNISTDCSEAPVQVY